MIKNRDYSCPDCHKKVNCILDWTSKYKGECQDCHEVFYKTVANLTWEEEQVVKKALRKHSKMMNMLAQ